MILDRLLPALILAFLAPACSMISSRMAGDPPRDGASDTDEPDFDPDTCGLWGRVYLTNQDSINIAAADPTLDGRGDMQISVLAVDGEGTPLRLEHMIDDMDALTQSFYCVPPSALAGVSEGFLTATLVDTWTFVEDWQYYQFRSIISDPIVSTLFLLSIWYPGSYPYDEETDLYWDSGTGSGNRFDIPLSLRTSRIEAEVNLSGFSTPTVRRARLCTYAVGMRDDERFNFAAIGASYYDLEESQIYNGSIIPVAVNVAAAVAQQYKIFVYYVEDRVDLAGSPYVQCNEFSSPRSCDCMSGVLAGPEGTTVTTGHSLAIGPITGVCTLDELSFCPE